MENTHFIKNHFFKTLQKLFFKWEDHFVKFSYGVQKSQSLWGALEVLGGWKQRGG